MIEPTPGRIVWFHPEPGDEGMNAPGPPFEAFKPPFAAIVCFVHNPRLVNLSVFDVFGRSHGRMMVPLLQDDDPQPTDDAWCEWMPYQKQVAAERRT